MSHSFPADEDPGEFMSMDGMAALFDNPCDECGASALVERESDNYRLCATYFGEWIAKRGGDE